MSRGTVHRTVRIDDGLWESAKAEAERRGENLSGVIRRALIDYIEAVEPVVVSAVGGGNHHGKTPRPPV